MRAVFLDRDGVVNRAFVIESKPIPPRSVDELIINEGVIEAVREIKEAGMIPVVVTNQPDVSRGLVDPVGVKKIHERIQVLTGLEHFYICEHDDQDDCCCRKPRPGLLIRASEELGIDLKSSFIVGDRWRDIQAGRDAGCKAYFIDYSYNEKRPEPPYFKVGSLLEAVKHLLANERQR